VAHCFTKVVTFLGLSNEEKEEEKGEAVVELAI
jgi:hypothetical protein